MTLVALDTDLCPDCGLPLLSGEWHEAALLRAGGYGATRRTSVRSCAECGYEITTEVAEVRP